MAGELTVSLALRQLPWVSTVLRSAGTALLLGFGVAFAALFRATELARDAVVDGYAALSEAHAELERVHRRLAASIAQEKDLVLAEERARSARELHDGLGHRLTLIKMQLDYADRARLSDSHAAWREVSAARAAAEQAMTEMRLWVRALHPVKVADLTGADAFEAIADAFRGTGLAVTIEQSGTDAPLDRERSLLAYRFVQEGLTNALRHAHATAVKIGVEQDSARLRLTLADDGAGADEVVPGFGLRSLTERAEALGGELTATAAPGEGFRLVLTVPAASSER